MQLSGFFYRLHLQRPIKALTRRKRNRLLLAIQASFNQSDWRSDSTLIKTHIIGGMDIQFVVYSFLL